MCSLFQISWFKNHNTKFILQLDSNRPIIKTLHATWKKELRRSQWERKIGYDVYLGGWGSMRMTAIYVAHIGRITVDGLAPHRLTMVTDTQWTNAGTWDVEEAMVYSIALEVRAVFINSICQHITTTTTHY